MLLIDPRVATLFHAGRLNMHLRGHHSSYGPDSLCDPFGWEHAKGHYGQQGHFFTPAAASTPPVSIVEPEDEEVESLSKQLLLVERNSRVRVPLFPAPFYPFYP